ncbi:MAG: extracellular solute-binding protein [Lachnospiraceae bacterium]|jgi:putative aldouronate transport system substrate-binding protein|nr:extracellular solute-binding protein [Lachnospiraceae bacterium]
MKNWRKANAILIAALVAAATILGGCGGSGESGTPTAETAEKAPTEESAAAPEKDAQEESEEISAASEDHKIGDGVTLTIFCDFQEAARSQYTDLGDNPVVKWIEEDTGLNLEFIHAPSGDDGSYFQQLLASGDLPDLLYTDLFHTTYPGGVEGAIADGLLYNVTELVETKAPNFMQLCNNLNDPNIERRIRGDEGNIIKFGSRFLGQINEDKVFNGLAVRADWLEKYGLEAPVTIDDYTNVLRTFKENGVQIPLALCEFSTNSQFNANNPIASAFDVSFLNFDLDADGNVHYSRTQDGYKEFLKVLKGWAEEGLIDTDFVSRNADECSKLFENGTAGMAFMHTYGIKMAVTAGPAVDPEFKILCLEMPKVNASDETHMSNIVCSINNFSFQVSASSKHPEEAVQFIDYLCRPEILKVVAYGINEEVETYTVNDDGTWSFTDFITDNPDGNDYNTMRALYTCEPLQIKYDDDLEAAQYSLDECHQSWDAWGKQNDNAYVLPKYLTLTTEESKEVTQIKTKLANYSDELVYRFIFGEEDIDSSWDGFVAQLKELGSERGEEIYKAAYDRYLARDKQ